MPNIRIKGVGLNKVVDCKENATVAQAIATFESVYAKNLQGMEFYSGGSKITNLNSVAPDEITAVKAKHESASRI